MPSSLEIGFFVLGAVLILIALVGGKIKIFVAEVSPVVTSPFLRIIAFVLGLAFILLARFPDITARASTAPPTYSQAETGIPVPTLPSALPSPTNSPPVPTDTPVPQKPSPVDSAISYWQNVNAGNFESAWFQLSPGFRQARHNNNYNDYVTGYQNMQLCRIEVSNPNLVQQENSFAVVTAHFTYYTGSQCNSSEFDFEMWLIYDAVTNAWLFDKNIVR